MQKKIYLLAVVVIAIVAATVVVYQQKNKPQEIVSDLGNGITATGPGKVELVPIENGTPPPSLESGIKINVTLEPAVEAAVRAKETALIADLKKTPTRLDLWLQLGVYRKIGGDYAGAEEAWMYVSKVGNSEINYIAYGNLGNLYMDFLKDYAKAEANYKAAIAIKPTVIEYYRQLYVLYTSFYKTNTRAAKDIIDAGLKANPNNPDLLTLKAELEAKPGFN
jgi:tetratricopeptide (TPR) repeat protein